MSLVYRWDSVVGFLKNYRASADPHVSLDIQERFIYLQSSKAKYAPLIRVLERRLSGERCGTTPREVLLMNPGVSINFLPGRANLPSLGAAAAADLRMVKESISSGS